MKKLKVLGLGTKIPITSEPLGAKEAAVIGIIETLHGSIAPRFGDGNKDDFDPQGKAKAQDEPKRPGMPVAAPEAEFVVELKKVGDPHGFPAAD